MRRYFVVLLLVLIAACKDEVTTPLQSITLSVAPSTVSLNRGGTAAAIVTLERGLFDGAITMTASGLPTGVTATSVTVPGGSSVGTINFSATTAAEGTSNVTLRATGSGLSASTATVVVSVIPPAFTLGLAGTAVSVVQGQSTTTTVNVERTGGFSGAINLTAENLPAGVTATFTPPAVPGSSAVMLITATNAAVLGPHTVTVRGTGAGVTDRTVTLNLTVAPPPAFALALSSNPITVVRGEATATTTINITRSGGFTGAVNLTALNLPAGVTASFNPASAADGTSVLTLTSSGAAPLGVHAITVRGSGIGVAEKTVTVNLTITEPPFPVGTLVVQGPSGLALIKTDGTNLRPLANMSGDDFAPQWDPSGSEIVFHRRIGSQSLFIVTPGAVGQVRLQNNGIPGVFGQFWAEYTPNGSLIYFQALLNSGISQIWRIRADGTGAERVSPAAEPRSAEAPSPSPNGQEVAYTLRDGPIEFELFIQNLTTGARRSLGAGFGARWSPDGQSLVFVAGPALVVQRADGTQRRVLNAGTAYRTGLDWSANSAWVVAARENGGIDLVKVDGSSVISIPNTQTLRQPSLKE